MTFDASCSARKLPLHRCALKLYPLAPVDFSPRRCSAAQGQCTSDATCCTDTGVVLKCDKASPTDATGLCQSCINDFGCTAPGDCCGTGGKDKCSKSNSTSVQGMCATVRAGLLGCLGYGSGIGAGCCERHAPRLLDREAMAWLHSEGSPPALPTGHHLCRQFLRLRRGTPSLPLPPASPSHLLPCCSASPTAHLGAQARPSAAARAAATHAQRLTRQTPLEPASHRECGPSVLWLPGACSWLAPQ